jgi:hypothetical protein
MDDFEPGGANRSFEPSIPNGLRKTCQEGKFPMSICKAIFFATIFSPMLICAAQTAVGGPATSVTPPASNVFTPAPPSEILKPALQEVLQTVGAVNLDKWKKGSVRDEAGKNIDAIQRYMHGTMPQLIIEGDAAPGTLSKVLPVSVNVDALYNVLVHVVEASRVSAPGDQVSQLQQALADLEKARVTFGNQLQQIATVQEKQMLELRTTVQTQAASLKAASTPPPAPKCPAPPAPAKKKKAAAKATTPGTATPATTTPGTTAKPAASTPANPPAKPQ